MLKLENTFNVSLKLKISLGWLQDIRRFNWSWNASKPFLIRYIKLSQLKLNFFPINKNQTTTLSLILLLQPQKIKPLIQNKFAVTLLIQELICQSWFPNCFEESSFACTPHQAKNNSQLDPIEIHVALNQWPFMLPNHQD